METIKVSLHVNGEMRIMFNLSHMSKESVEYAHEKIRLLSVELEDLQLSRDTPDTTT